MARVGIEEDRDLANERIAAGLAAAGAGVDVRIVDAEVSEASILILEEPDGVMRTNLAPNAVWYVQHMWGDTATWRPMIVATVAETIRRAGQAAVMRYRQLGPVPDAVVSALGLQLRLVVDDDSGRLMWEITAGEAQTILSLRPPRSPR